MIVYTGVGGVSVVSALSGSELLEGGTEDEDRSLRNAGGNEVEKVEAILGERRLRGPPGLTCLDGGSKHVLGTIASADDGGLGAADSRTAP